MRRLVLVSLVVFAAGAVSAQEPAAIY